MQPMPPKLVDILLAFDLDQSYFVPFLHLQKHLLLVLLFDVVLVFFSLLLYLPEEAMI